MESKNRAPAPVWVEIIKGEQDGSDKGPMENGGLGHVRIRIV